MTFFRKTVRRPFLVLLFAGGILLFLVHNLIELRSSASVKTEDFNIRGFGLILDTRGCRVPKLDPFDRSVRHLIHVQGPHVCRGQPVFLEVHPNATLVVNRTVLASHYNVSVDELSCTFRSIRREHEPEGHRTEDTISVGEKRPLRFGVPLGEEFLEVECNVGKPAYRQYVGLTPIKPDVERTKGAKARDISQPLNVVLIGIDSISKLNFLRHFRKTHSFLKQLSAFDMKGYTKVGDNTFPNLTPLLTGHFAEHYWNESFRRTLFFDGLDFIWKDYSAAGYRTLYAEDMPFYGTYQYLKRGFKDPPTDYYFRPLSLAIQRSKLRQKDTCLNNQLEIEIFYQYLKSFLETMGHRPVFSFIMVSTLTHNEFNHASKADEPTYKILNDFHGMGVMNNSLVVLFSDHGIRYGEIRNTYIGKIEERMPFMYLMFPKWFLSKHPDVAINLKLNQNRLVTLFDLHATLHHLLKLSTTIDETGDDTHRGQSLMSEISEHRTCEKANILPHWCPCHVYHFLPPTDARAKAAAAALIDQINLDLNPVKDKCERLEVDRIEDTRVGQANDLVQRYVDQTDANEGVKVTIKYGKRPKSSIFDYLVTLTAKPGGGVFEGTVRHNIEENTTKVLGISRINVYREQSLCVDSPSLQKYCYCK